MVKAVLLMWKIIPNASEKTSDATVHLYATVSCAVLGLQLGKSSAQKYDCHANTSIRMNKAHG